MAKEEDIKKIELKVSVDCCDGCKKKVLKALAVKGVLRTEIHPSLPKVTVLGNVDPQKLIKKLAKCGKIAELLPVESKKQEIGDKKSEGAKIENSTGKVDEKEKTREAISEKKTGNFSKDSKPNREESTGTTDIKTDKYLKVTETEGNSKCDVGNPIMEGVKSATPTNTTTTTAQESRPLPELNYFVNAGMVQATSTNTTTTTAQESRPLPELNYFVNAGMVQAPRAQVYYTMDPNYGVPMTYYMPSSYPIPPPATSYPSPFPKASSYPPPPMTNSYPAPTLYCTREPCYHDMQAHQPQLVQPQPPRLTEYFNDENTGGCHVM